MVESAEPQQLDLGQTVHLVLEFMKENNLHTSLNALAEETGVAYARMANKDDFIENVKRGAWNVVLKQLHQSGVRLSKRHQQMLYEQLIKELILEKEYSISQLLLQEQAQVLSEPVLGGDGSVIHGEGHVLQTLWDLCQIREPPPSVAAVFSGKTLQQSRIELAEALQQSLEEDSIPPNRLVELLSMGLEYEKHLKSGRSLLVAPTQKQPQEKSSGNAIVQHIKSHKLFTGEFKIQTIAIAHYGKHLVLGGRDGMIEVWDYTTLQLDLTIPYQAKDLYMLHRKAVLALIFSRDDQILASGDSEGIIRVWKFRDGKKLREIDTQGGEHCGISSLLLTLNNSQLVAGCLDKSIRVYGLKSGNLMKSLRGHQSFIQSIQFFPGGEQRLISSAEDGVIYVWNLQEADPKSMLIKQIETPAHKLGRDMLLNNIQLNPQNPKELLICHRYRSAYLVNAETSEVLQEYQSSQSKDEELLYACFSTDANHVYAFSSTKSLYIFDKRSGKLASLLLVPFAKADILGMEVRRTSEETMVLYSFGELFKLVESSSEQ